MQLNFCTIFGLLIPMLIIIILGINRILVKAGLEVLFGSVRPGLTELCKVSGIGDSGVSCEDIGYRLGPRLNAAGRMGDAGRALELLVTEDIGRARDLAQELNSENELRKSVLEAMCQEGELQAQSAVQAGKNGLIIVGEGWHPGVIGIGAASAGPSGAPYWTSWEWSQAGSAAGWRGTWRSWGVSYRMPSPPS